MSVMDAKGIILELQWKKKYAIRNGGDDISNIGVCYMAEPSVDLDWRSFKSYLCQNVGTKEDVTFAYVDSEGDEIPIESECEFQEALKFARQRARRGRAIVLKLDRPNGSEACPTSSNLEKPPMGATAKSQKISIIRQSELQKNVKPHNTKTYCKTVIPTEKAKSKVAAVGLSQQTNSKVIHSVETKDDKSPVWFEKEKEKIKTELVTEVTTLMERELNKTLVEIKKMLRNFDRTYSAANGDIKKKKKKVSDKVQSEINAAMKRSVADEKGNLLELWWKKKYAVRRGTDETSSTGVCYMVQPSPDLDWKTFKIFLCHDARTEEDIKIGYVDSEGDEIPIDSECEFQEALKFATRRARQGRPVILTLDRFYVDDTPNVSANTEKLPAGVKATKTDIKNEMQKNMEPLNANHSGTEPGAVAAQPTKIEMVYSEDSRDTAAPIWFEKEKEEMKNEIVVEVTSQIKREFQQALIEMKKTLAGSDRTHSSSAMEEVTCAKKKKKKVSDEESSDANAVEQREYKLLRKIEKLQKREKKLEKKLDSKLEKLEHRTKRMLEKKSHSRSHSEPVSEQNTSIRKRSDVSVGTYLMDAILLNGSSQPDIHIKLGESFTKVWQIMNTGTLPWTDKTELRLAWGTTGLEPQVTTVKCPALEPGERGQISVTFKAPEFAGTFESYWHFYHMGVRFGHWISCAVIVEPKEEAEAAFNNCDGRQATDNQVEDFDTKSRNDHAVDLTVRSKSEESDLEVIPNIEDDNENCRDAEYESDSDSDNVSVISNGVSVSSESDDDKFVVVSMPASSTTEGNIFGSGDTNITEISYPELVAGAMTTAATNTVTSTITTDAPAQSVATPLPNVLKTTYFMPTTTDFETAQLREYYEAPLQLGANDEKVNNLTPGPEETPQTDTVASHIDEQIPSLSESNVADQPTCDLNQTMKTNGNLNNVVFAVDMLGRTVPVKLKNKPKQNSNSSSPHSSGSYPDVCLVSVEESEEAHPDQNYVSSDHGNGSETASNYVSSSENVQQRSNESYAESGGNIIHILPETLMNGAVNVATSAISTARAVISNLRTIPSRNSYSSPWEAGSPTDSSHPSVTSKSLTLILDMGFTDRERILTLLRQHDNDISKVVSELVSPTEESSSAV